MKEHPLLRELMGDLDTPGSQAGRFFLGYDVEILTKLNEQIDMWIGKKNLGSNVKFDQHPNFFPVISGYQGSKRLHPYVGSQPSTIILLAFVALFPGLETMQAGHLLA